MFSVVPEEGRFFDGVKLLLDNHQYSHTDDGDIYKLLMVLKLKPSLCCLIVSFFCLVECEQGLWWHHHLLIFQQKIINVSIQKWKEFNMYHFFNIFKIINILRLNIFLPLLFYTLFCTLFWNDAFFILASF